MVDWRKIHTEDEDEVWCGRNNVTLPNKKDGKCPSCGKEL